MGGKWSSWEQNLSPDGTPALSPLLAEPPHAAECNLGRLSLLKPFLHNKRAGGHTRPASQPLALRGGTQCLGFLRMAAVPPRPPPVYSSFLPDFVAAGTRQLFCSSLCQACLLEASDHVSTTSCCLCRSPQRHWVGLGCCPLRARSHTPCVRACMWRGAAARPAPESARGPVGRLHTAALAHCPRRAHAAFWDAAGSWCR